MKLGTSLIVFFVAIIALVAEIILYLVIAAGTAFTSGFGNMNYDINSMQGTAYFFVALMIFTVSAGVLAPICSLIEMVVKKENIGLKIMATLLFIIIICLVTFHIKNNPNQLPSSDYNDVASNAPPNTLVEKELDVKKEKDSYISKILIKNIKIGSQYSSFYSPAIYGEIKNSGDKTLKEVEITVYCLDKEGKAVYENKFYPVLVTKILSSDNEPLKPNYSTKFGYSLDDAPSDWAGKVNVKVTNIEFIEKDQNNQ